MFCPMCGSKVADDANFCECCGALVDEGAPMESVASPDAQPNVASIADQVTSMKTRSRKGIPMVLLVVIVVLATATLAFAAYHAVNYFVENISQAEQSDQASMTMGEQGEQTEQIVEPARTLGGWSLAFPNLWLGRVDVAETERPDGMLRQVSVTPEEPVEEDLWIALLDGETLDPDLEDEATILFSDGQFHLYLRLSWFAYYGPVPGLPDLPSIE